MTDASSLAVTRERRILEFARSDVFARTFEEGMALVEETAAYLDGPGRAAAKRLDRAAALAYAGESMRLTTRLMQVASWLLVQRALREGDMLVHEALDEKYRLALRVRTGSEPDREELPTGLADLIARAERLFERVSRLDARMFGEGEEEAAEEGPNPVLEQLGRLRAAFGPE